MEYYDEYHKKRDSEFEVISKDIQKLKKKMPSNYFHFETIRHHSKVKVFRYIIQLRITNLRFLQKYNGQNHGIFLQLLSDFYRLVKWIQIIPTKDEFMKLTGPLTTGNLMEEFGSNNSDYERFLEMISSEPPNSPSPEQREIMRDLIIDGLKKYDVKYGKEKTLSLINSHLNPNEKLSVQIQMYFPNKIELKKILYPVISDKDP